MTKQINDTIAAVATAWGEGGVGIIRVSGPAAIEAAHGSFSPLPPPGEIRERYLYYGEIKDGQAAIDNGFFVCMKGPRSYTGEDTVELHCHGGPLILKKVLSVILSKGARLAEPGEFTKRAFLNGKLDLAQAEAVADLISSQTELSLASARGRLEGALSRKVNTIKETIFGLLSNIEAELDFPEDEVSSLGDGPFVNGLTEAESALRDLLSTFDEGRALKDGVRTLILGRPNVGKSSLLNILLREERAIVTPIPGTTRDIIEETLNIRGIPVRLMDTAGLRETDDAIEAIGVRAAREKIKDADIILFVVDSSGVGGADLALLGSLSGKKVLVVANKTDLAGEKGIKAIEDLFRGFHISFISAINSTGIEGLKDRIFEEAAGRPYGQAGDASPGEIVTSIRHKEALQKALAGIERTRTAIAEGLAREFVATDLRWALDRLGEITGETTTEDILDRIFSTFCIGK